jgi:hypothetical protein
MHMNMYFFFEKLNILCIFRNRFFDPVLFRFFSGSGFLGSTGSMTGSVLVTLLLMHDIVKHKECGF